MAKGDDIEERLIDFAVRVIRMVAHLPKTQVGRHISGQLVRSGTAPAPHYAEARGAESKADFIHKLGICLKELNESRIWLKMIVRTELLPATQLQNLLTECDELCRIINRSRQTAQANLRSPEPPTESDETNHIQPISDPAKP
jgi:four helix bundle protein